MLLMIFFYTHNKSRVATHFSVAKIGKQVNHDSNLHKQHVTWESRNLIFKYEAPITIDGQSR